MLEIFEWSVITSETTIFFENYYKTFCASKNASDTFGTACITISESVFMLRVNVLNTCMACFYSADPKRTIPSQYKQPCHRRWLAAELVCWCSYLKLWSKTSVRATINKLHGLVIGPYSWHKLPSRNLSVLYWNTHLANWSDQLVSHYA